MPSAEQPGMLASDETCDAKEPDFEAAESKEQQTVIGVFLTLVFCAASKQSPLNLRLVPCCIILFV